MKKRAVFAFLAVLALGHSGPAHCMGFQSSLEFLAWSEDGLSMLVRVNGYGPEGGGYERLRIISAAAETGGPYEVHNDSSPGDGSRPQQVSDGECRDAVRALRKEAGKLGFAGLKFNTSRCEAKYRGGLVKTREKRPASLKSTDKEQRVFEADSLSISLGKKKLLVKQGERTVCERSGVQRLERLELFISPTNRLLFIVGHGERYGARVLETLVKDSGGPDGKWSRLGEMKKEK